MSAPTDAFGRELRDLRVSVTDKCNFRCRYCMPSERYGFRYKFLPTAELLTFAEIERLARVFVDLGVNKLRLTGGEPLLRRDLPDLTARLARLNPALDIALTTNGFLLPKYAAALKKSGLKRLNISLDALDETIFKAQTGTNQSPATVLAGLDAARAAGFADIKVNAVIRRGVNQSEILPLARRFRNAGVTLRFIEFMDVGTLNEWRLDDIVPATEIIAVLRAEYELEQVAPAYVGEVAKLYRYADGAGYVGFVTSISQPFCRDCIRARLTADGKLITCLFGANGVSLRDLMRAGASDAELTATVRDIWTKREDRYSELRAGLGADAPKRKIEMYQVGG